MMNISGYNKEMGNFTTLLSYAERGKFGKSSYRGNYAGQTLIQLIQYLQQNGIETPYIFDGMVGGGTSKDVADFMNCPSVTDDIHKGFDIVNDDIHDTNFDLAMLHYPYWKMIDYASDLPLHLQNKDMSRMEWKEFIEAVSHVNAKVAAHSKYVAVLVGDMAYQGGIKSIQREMAWIGQPIRHLIKVQHNAQSYKKEYNGKFIPIVHEHLILFRTNMKDFSVFVIEKAKTIKQNLFEYLSWHNVVKKAFEEGFNTPRAIEFYVKTNCPDKLKKNKTPQATIRRCLQELTACGYLKRLEKGVYTNKKLI